jgi:hypothetical protein
VSDTLALAEGMESVLTPVSAEQVDAPVRKVADGNVSVSVRQNSPLKATLRTTRKRGRDVVYAA